MHNRPRRLEGFTLVEIMIVVVIIGLLAALAIPAFQRVKEKSRFSALANDLRVFAEAFEAYAMENGSYPLDANIGIMPPQMKSGKSTLSEKAFVAGTPIGGRYDWDYNVFGITAAVSVTDVNISTADLQRFDAQVDDGDLTTGRYRGTTGRYSLILQL